MDIARLLEDDRLEQRARELGVDIGGESGTGGMYGPSPRAADHVLQRRVMEAERGIRESRLWVLAMISAVASAASAIAALIAVARK